MWNIFFTMSFSGMLIGALGEYNKIWTLIFHILMLVCIVAQAITENKQEERIKKLEKRLEEMVGNNER